MDPEKTLTEEDIEKMIASADADYQAEKGITGETAAAAAPAESAAPASAAAEQSVVSSAPAAGAAGTPVEEAVRAEAPETASPVPETPAPAAPAPEAAPEKPPVDPEKAKANNMKILAGVLIAAAVILGGVIGYQEYQKSPAMQKKKIADAQALVDSGSYEDAETLLIEAMNMGEAPAENYLALIDSYAGMEDAVQLVDTAVNAEEKLQGSAVTKVHEKTEEALLTIAGSQVEKGNSEAAVKTIKSAERLGEEAYANLTDKAKAQLLETANAGGDTAITAWETLAGIDENNVDAYLKLFDLYMDAGNEENAIAWLTKGREKLAGDQQIELKWQELPYGILKNLTFATIYDLSVGDYDFALVDQNGQEVSGTEVDKGDAMLHIEKIETTPSSQEGFKDIAITASVEIHPVVTAPSALEPMVTYSVPGINFVDYYTGQEYQAKTSMVDDFFESEMGVNWRYNTYPLSFQTAITWDKEWADYSESGSTYTETFNGKCHYDIIATVPNDYDGLILYCVDSRKKEDGTVDEKPYYMRLVTE